MTKDCCRQALKTQQGTCVFGCGCAVDSDTKMCGHCKDHSANRIECECGTAFEDWDGKYTEVV